MFLLSVKLRSSGKADKWQSLNRQNLSPEVSSTVFAAPPTIRVTLTFSCRNANPWMYFWLIRRPTVDEIFLCHIIFRRHPDIPVPVLSFFSQMRQRQFVQDLGADLFSDSRQHLPAAPSIEELFKTSARPAPASLKEPYSGKIVIFIA
jgi:hypothetical protein